MNVERKLAFVAGGWLFVMTVAGCGTAVRPGIDNDTKAKPMAPTPTIPANFLTADCHRINVKTVIPAGWYFNQGIDTAGFEYCSISEQPVALNRPFDTGVTIQRIPILFGTNPTTFAREIMSRPAGPRLPIGDIQERVIPPFTILERDFMSTEGNKLRALRGRAIIYKDNLYVVIFETPKPVEQNNMSQFGQPILDGVVIEGFPTR